VPPPRSPISSLECVAALRRLGFRLKGASASTVTMTSPDGNRHVFIPRHRRLKLAELEVLLLFAGVRLREFQRTCALLESGEFETPEAPSSVRLTIAGFDALRDTERHR
jgi:hypothetical protein